MKVKVRLSFFKIPLLFTAGFVFFGYFLFAQEKANEFKPVVKSLAKQLIESNKTGKPSRLAVITFIPTKNKNEPNEFGEYITESLISELSADKKAFKLFERSRLDMILKENDLMLSDLMDQKQAIRVGELAPIDVIFSGSYTKLKTYIDINCRLIDVVTGEISVSFSDRIATDSDLESLFADDQKSKTDKSSGSTEDLCKQSSDQINLLLKDLSSEQKIKDVVAKAVKIPFDLNCGKIHFSVLSSFMRYKIKDESYNAFLKKTLDTIAFPANDYRASESLRYLNIDSMIDDTEWETGLNVIKRYNYSVNSIIRILFSGSLRKTDLSDEQQRIDRYFDLASAEKIGLPVPFNYNSAFFALTEGLRANKDNRLLKYVYERYSRQLRPEEPLKGISQKKVQDGIYGLLTGMYKSEIDPAEKRIFLTWLTEFFNAQETNENSSKQIYDFVRSFELTSNENTNNRIRTEFPAEDQAFLVQECKDKLSEGALLTPYNNQKTDRIHFCAANDIPVPGGIPTMKEAAAILGGNDWKEKIRVMTILELMKTKPKEIEQTLVDLTQKKELENKKDLMDMQESAVVVLGNIRTENPAAIRFMIENTTSFEYGMPDKCKDALVKIGKPAVPHLLNKLRSLTNREDSLEYQIIVVLGRIGKDARAAKSDIQAILNRTTHKERRSTFEAALQAME